MVVAAGKQIELDSIHRSPHAPSSGSSPDCPSLHRCERSSPVKNRTREICTSGTVRGEDGNILTYSEESDAQATYHWMREITAALPVDLPFLASIAVGWRQLVLREERVTQPAYLRLDGVVWRYVLYSFAFLLLERGTLVICAFLAQILPSKRTFLLGS
jgi:hypothetical protein